MTDGLKPISETLPLILEAIQQAHRDLTGCRIDHSVEPRCQAICTGCPKFEEETSTVEKFFSKGQSCAV